MQMSQRNRSLEKQMSQMEQRREQMRNGAQEAKNMSPDNVNKTEARMGGTKTFDKAKFIADYRRKYNLGVNEPLGQNVTKDLMAAMQSAMKSGPQNAISNNVDTTKRYAGVNISSYQVGARAYGTGASNIAGGVGVE